MRPQVRAASLKNRAARPEVQQKMQAQFTRRFTMHGQERLFTITLLVLFLGSNPANATTVGFQPPVDYPNVLWRRKQH
jgi:hypothetical protein